MTATAPKQTLFRLVINGKRIRNAGLYLPSVPPVGDVITQEDGTALVVIQVAPLIDGSYVLVLSTRPN
jgi:hypothetical protein